MADNFISKIQIGSSEYKIRCEYSDILNTPTIGASNLKLKAQYTAATGTTADGGINIFNANSTSDSTFTITGSAGIKTFRTSGTNTVTIMHDNILSASGTTSPNHTSISNLNYGSSFYVPVISYNKTGHITGVSTASYKLNFADNKVTQSPISTEGKYPILLKHSIDTTEETNTTNFIADFSINPYSKELYGATIDAIVIKENSVTLASKYKSIQTAIGASYTVSLNGNTLQRHSIQQSSQGIISVNNGVDLFSFKSTPSSNNKVLTESDISGLVGAMVYKGTTTTISNNVLGTNPTISGNPVQGWTFVASSAVSITSSTKLLGKSMATTGAVEVGDMFVYNGTNWNIISGENQVSNSNPTLNFGSSHTLGTIDGTNFTVTMPANPNTDEKVKQSPSTTTDWRKILLSYNTASPNTASITSDTASIAYYSNALSVKPSTGEIKAGGFIKNPNSDNILLANGNDIAQSTFILTKYAYDGCYFPNAVQDYDKNWYGAVIIGDQVWLGENLRSTHYADGTSISSYVDKTNTTFSLEERGLFYKWAEMMNGSSASSLNPSGVQGISPSGWHVPSVAEYTELIDYLGTDSKYYLNNDRTYVAKSVASIFGWTESSTEYTVGYEQQKNNSAGLNIVPAGRRGPSSNYDDFNYIDAYLHTTNNYSSTTFRAFIVDNSSANLSFSANLNKTSWFLSVRCVCDLKPTQFISWYVNTYGSMQHHLNQKIKVGNTSFGADDTISLVNGTNITITPDTTNKTITINAPSNISAFTNNASYATVSQLSNYLPLAGGSMNYDAKITLRDSADIRMILSGGYIRSVIPSTVPNGWARGISSTTIDAPSSNYYHLGWCGDNGPSGTGTGFKYTFLGGDYNNHILRLNKSGTAQFFGKLYVPSLASGSYTYTMPSATGILALKSDITDEKITPISSSTNAEFPILLTPQSGVNASNNGKPNFTSNVTINTASGIITASSFVKAGANSSEILMADGSTTLAPIIDGEYFPNAIQDYDGNWYDAVVIGTQVWMTENMNTTHFSNGTEIAGNSGSVSTSVPFVTDTPYYFDYIGFGENGNYSYRENVGLLYNWCAAMNSSTTEGARGIAPSGWHIPTDAEYKQLMNYVSSQARYVDSTFDIGRALAAQDGWSGAQNTGLGYNTYLNNATGWSGKPGGYKVGTSGNSYVSFNGYWWTSTPGSTTDTAQSYRIAYSASPYFNKHSDISKTQYRSVRCISDKSPLEFREWYFNTYNTLQHIVDTPNDIVLRNSGVADATPSIVFKRGEEYPKSEAHYVDWFQNVNNNGVMTFSTASNMRSTKTTVMTLATNALTLTSASVVAASFVKNGGTNSQILLAGGSVMNTSAFAASSHSHGNITNGGTITTNVAIASGDRLVITDSSATSSINATSITFNGASTNTYLSQAGTWQTLKGIIGSATAQTAPSSAATLYGSGNITLHNSAWTGAALTASKLSTARTIWGQSFDGSGNVNGTLYIDGSSVSNPGSWNEGIRIKPATNGWTSIVLGGTDLTNSGTSANSWSMHSNTGNFYLNKNSSSSVKATRLWGHDNGFTLGSTAASTYALNVGGTVYATVNMIADGDITAGGDMRAKGNDLFLGPSTGAQGHIKYDNSDLSIKFIFD